MSAPLSEAQTALRDAVLNDFGPQFGVGGSLWTRTRTSGNGVSGPVTSSGSPVTITGYVRRVNRAAMAGSSAGVGVVDLVWLFTGPLTVTDDHGAAITQNLATGDVLASQATTGLTFSLTGAVAAAGYIAFFAEQAR